jgi:hypothetical protein
MPELPPLSACISPCLPIICASVSEPFVANASCVTAPIGLTGRRLGRHAFFPNNLTSSRACGLIVDQLPQRGGTAQNVKIWR